MLDYLGGPSAITKGLESEIGRLKRLVKCDMRRI